MIKAIYWRAGKRGLDCLLGLFLFILFTPFMGFVALMIIIGLGNPAIFRQLRPGKGALPFVMYKFRTMSEEYSPAGQVVPEGLRISRLGRILRKLSVDELPELLNVIKGDMSLVGPRPLLMEYLDRYTPEQARRHEVKPGITGWAQVHGRNAISWEEKFRLDVWYVDHVSLKLDIKILWRTFIKVLKHEGISAEGHATMPEFFRTKAGRNEN